MLHVLYMLAMLYNSTHNNIMYFRGKSVVHEDIWSSGIGSERPDRTSSQQIPVVLGLEEFTYLLLAPRDLNNFVLNVLR